MGTASLISSLIMQTCKLAWRVDLFLGHSNKGKSSIDFVYSGNIGKRNNIHEHVLQIFSSLTSSMLAKTTKYKETFSSHISKNCMADLAQTLEFSQVCFSVCSRRTLISARATFYCLSFHLKENLHINWKALKQKVDGLTMVFFWLGIPLNHFPKQGKYEKVNNISINCWNYGENLIFAKFHSKLAYKQVLFVLFQCFFLIS